MSKTLPISSGIDGIPTNTVPDDPAAFVAWFKSVGIKRWLANADVRNAVSQGPVAVTGTIATPATIGLTTAATALINAIETIPNDTVIGNVAGATGTPAALTQAQLTALVNDFTASLSGAVPASGGGTTNFLRADGTWDPVTASITTADSVQGNGSVGAPIELVGDAASPGNSYFYGTNNSGTKGWFAQLATSTADSVTTVGGALQLSGDSASPGNSYYYGTNASGVKGWYASTAAANPTAKVGSTAVNGSASTFMRSDAAPPIDLTASFAWTGNQVWNPASGSPGTFKENGTTIFAINGTSSPTLQGYGPTAAGLVDMTPDTGTFTGTLTGCTTSPTATITWTRVGKLCLLYLNGALTGTSNATTMTVTGLPAEIQPATLTQYCPTYVENNSAYVMGVCAVSASGTITFYAGAPGTAFTNAGTKGLANTTVAYLLN